MIVDRLMDRIKSKGNPTVLGLDTRIEYLPDSMQPKEGGFAAAAWAILQYNRGLVDALCDIVPAVKLQAAYYEMYSVPGMQALYETARYAADKGLVVVGDGKRNDIGATASSYAAAYLGETSLIGKADRAFPMDFLTVNPYLGSDGVLPFVEQCVQWDKGIFVLVKTSNPSSGELQDLICGGRPIYEIMGGYVKEWGSGLLGDYGYSAVGAVVGATYPEQGQRLREQMDGVFFLVPGYGAQGATGKDLAGLFDENGEGAIVNASRSLLCAHQKERYAGLDYSSAARKEAERMREDICSHL
ncbi:MAG: orotidine-5'-phosphate decarboxylase [Christensenellales bacterium]|jgi:orotidine-5'-phosphate decarboxylase